MIHAYDITASYHSRRRQDSNINVLPYGQSKLDSINVLHLLAITNEHFEIYKKHYILSSQILNSIFLVSKPLKLCFHASQLHVGYMIAYTLNQHGQYF